MFFQENEMDIHNQDKVNIPLENGQFIMETTLEANKKGFKASIISSVFDMWLKESWKDMKIWYGQRKKEYTIGLWNTGIIQNLISVVRAEILRLNIDTQEIRNLKWTSMGYFTLEKHQIFCQGQKTKQKQKHTRNGIAIIVLKRESVGAFYNVKSDKHYNSVSWQAKQYYSDPGPTADRKKVEQF